MKFDSKKDVFSGFKNYPLYHTTFFQQTLSAIEAPCFRTAPSQTGKYDMFFFSPEQDYYYKKGYADAQLEIEELKEKLNIKSYIRVVNTFFTNKICLLYTYHKLIILCQIE